MLQTCVKGWRVNKLQTACEGFAKNRGDTNSSVSYSERANDLIVVLAHARKGVACIPYRVVPNPAAPGG